MLPNTNDSLKSLAYLVLFTRYGFSLERAIRMVETPAYEATYVLELDKTSDKPVLPSVMDALLETIERHGKFNRTMLAPYLT